MAMSKPAFNSTLDEALMAQLKAARGEPAVKKPSVKAREAFVYDANNKPFTSVIPLDDPISQDVPLPVFQVEDWPEEFRAFIPEVDKGYIFDAAASEELAAAIHNNDVVLLTGPKGSGKTTLPQMFAARQRIPVFRTNCKLDMESGNLFGSVKFTPDAGVVWCDGPLPIAARIGAWLIIDEVSRAPAGIVNALMRCFERGSDISLDDKPSDMGEKIVKKHPNFRIFCTDNTQLQGDTTGHYVGTMPQDEALIDRFETTITLGYLSMKHEVRVITSKVPGCDSTLAQQMVQLASMIRSAYDQGNIGFTMSPRGLVMWANKAVFWEDPAKAFKTTFFNKLVPTDRLVVAEFYHTVFAVNL